MKTKSFAVIVSGMAVVALCLVGACFPQTSNAQTESAPAPAPDGSTGSVAPDDLTALPPNVYPSSPLAQVIKLTQSGVSEDVIMAYVTNSGSTFNLDPDKIIYLKDIGAPDDLVTAMMQRDQVLQAQMAASAYQPPPQPAPTDTTVTEATVVTPPPTEVTVNYFNDTLAPYGNWVDVEGYGRCWRPTVMVVNAGWQPYCDHGHWVYTDYGWYWISDYSWGWAPFHYGRWFHHARFGWCWTPDTVWGPSWVTWRYSGDYCGWAPLPPFTAYVSGIGFTYHGAAVSVNFDFGLGASFFTFVPTRNFCDPHPRRYRVESREAAQIYNHTTVINNFNLDSRSRTFINHGIDPERITAVTRTEIHPVAIHNTTRPVARGEQLGRDGRTLIVNRPHFTDNPPQSNRDVPPHNPPVARPVIGSPYQPPNNHGNDNSQPQQHYQPAAPTPLLGQPQAPRGGTFGSQDRNGPTPPITHAPPSAPIQPPANNNLNNSTDNRRYPSPHMQQIEQQSQHANPGNSGGHVGVPVTPPAQPPQHNYGAPATTPSPPAQPPQRNYVSPRNEMPPSESRPNYSQPPAAGNQPHSAPPAASPPAQSQRSGGNKNQNGQ
jgi:hypothetical protein